MSYSDDAVRAKLSALNESQESIVTVAQWIMFHRRHADRTASLWLERLQDSPSSAKRLNLIYLANEVVQQSRARSKQDFLLAFEPLIADATALAYKGASQDMQGKLRRVVEVWRQRTIFDMRIQEQLEGRLAEADKSKTSARSGNGGGAPRLGGSLFGGGGGGAAPELENVNKAQVAVNKASAIVTAPLSTANTEYAKMTDPATPVPSAPVRAAKLRGLVKDLMAAHGAVDASISARRELIAALEKLAASNKAKLADEESTGTVLKAQIEGMETTIRDVEDSIMRGQDAPMPGMDGNTNGGNDWSQRPETEGFTPPPPDVEAFTPPPEQVQLAEQLLPTTTGAEPISEEPPVRNEPPPSYVPPPAIESPTMDLQAILRSAQGETPPTTSSSTGAFSGDPRLKRRKTSHRASNNMEDDFMNAGGLGVDEDGISAMLGGQSG